METNSSSDDDVFAANMSDPRLNLAEMNTHYPVVWKIIDRVSLNLGSIAMFTPAATITSSKSSATIHQ